VRRIGEPQSIVPTKPIVPGFDAAVRRHRLLDMITRASDIAIEQEAR
jgi:hypothetical protein